MPPLDSIARVLQELIEQGFVVRSALGVRARVALEPLFHAGALREERSGAGWCIRVVNPAAVARFADVVYPGGLAAAGEALGRADAVGALRNAKRGSNRTGEPVLIRGFTEAKLVSTRGELDVRQSTQFGGCACFVITDALDWNYAGIRVALVENLEPFLRFEERFDGFDAAIYCAGRLSERLLRWLASQAFDLVHFGDYDPVGLQEYRRVKACCADRVALFIPENLRELVRRYGRPELLRDSSAVLAGLRSGLDEHAGEVVQCLDDFGLGLEQEVLWANLEDSSWRGD